MSDEFNQPAAGGGYFEPKNAVGHLILVLKVHEVYHNSTNVYAGKPQPRDEAKVDVVDLSGDGMLRERVIMTHPGLVNRLYTGATKILGRIGQVESGKGNPAFVLNNFEDGDVEVAKRWVEHFGATQFAAPQAPAQVQQQAPLPPAQGQWGTPQVNPQPGWQAPAQAEAPGWAQQGTQAAPSAPQVAQAPQSAPAAAQGPQNGQTVALPPGVDPAALAALMSQLGATPIQESQTGGQPPY